MSRGTPTLAVQTGATTRELTARLGHASPATAQRYQRAAARRDQRIVDVLEAAVTEAKRPDNPDGANTMLGKRGQSAPEAGSAC